MNAVESLRQALSGQYENFKSIKKGSDLNIFTGTLQPLAARVLILIVSADVQKNHQARQQLIQQKSENEMVLEVALCESLGFEEVAGLER